MRKSPNLQWDDVLERLGVNDARYGDSRVLIAWEYAQKTYQEHRHWTGEKFDAHVLGVLQVLMRFSPDADAVIACLLHHVLQFSDWNMQQLEAVFGKTVQTIVRHVHLLSHVTLRNRRIPVQNLRKMLVQASDDPRALLMILCDRCSVLQHVASLPEEEQRRICQDALQLFAPAAARLGIYTLKHELERLAFPIAYPTDAEHIAGQLHLFWKEHAPFLQKTATYTESFLYERNVKADVKAREKQLYSIFAKMRRKSLSDITHIYDLFALRVVVESVEECYRALGVLHTIGHAIPHRFKDYISFPKPNGYRSMHTTLTHLPGMPPHVFVEVQIRTIDMHRQAELGIAAHWQYKEFGAMQHAARKRHLEDLLQEDLGIGNADHIFVLTPKNEVIALLENATPLDFAFHIHSDLGLCFRAARVNGAIVPMDHVLENGDVVEILRWKSPRPSERWLSLVRTSCARNRLRHFFGAKYPAETSTNSSSEIMPASPKQRVVSKAEHAKWHVVCEGIAMPIVYAKCCVPEESRESSSLQGVIARCGIVKIHRADCAFLKKANSARRITAMWQMMT